MAKIAPVPKKDFEEPDLFQAAIDDDIDHMNAALGTGQKLDQQRPGDRMTPLHVAAVCGSESFIREAVLICPEAAWVRDHNNLRPIEHSETRSDRRSAAYLTNAMFPETAPIPIPPEQ